MPTVHHLRSGLLAAIFLAAGCEYGGRHSSKKLQEAQNAVLSSSSSPFRFYYIVDGKSITGVYPDEKIAEESEKILTWGQGMTAYLPKQVKLFADGAIFSQLMQVKDGYTDGHKGEWMMDPDLFARRSACTGTSGTRSMCT